MEPGTEASAPYRPGMLIGNKFVLLRLIAEGGMGAVFEAKDELVQRHVAIKLLRAEHAQDAEMVGRFRREAALTASIQHPNVVAIHEMGQRRDGSFYIVEELLRGESLRLHLTRRRRFSAADAIEILLPVMGALIAAHGLGIVHRDLKPENVVLTRSASGELVPKIIDFGLAKGQPAFGPPSLTTVGEVLGTPHYMSPEQVRGMHPLDARCDVWAIGVMLYELLAGACPFGAQGEPPQIVMTQILTHPLRPIRSLAPEVPEALEAILGVALERDLARRLPSMQALRDAILALTNRRSILIATGQDARAAGRAVRPPAEAPARDRLWLELDEPPASSIDEDRLDPSQLAAAEEPPLSSAQGPPSSQAFARAHGVRAEMAWARAGTPSSPAERDQHVESAERALGVNRLEEAIASAQQALAAGPDDDAIAGQMWLVQAIAHRWRGDYPACDRCAREAAGRLERGSGGWYAALGHVAIAAGHLGRGETLLALFEELKKVEVAEARSHYHVIALCRLATFLVRTGLPGLAQEIVSDAEDLVWSEESTEPLARAWLDVARAELAGHRGDLVIYLRRVELSMEAFTAAGDMRNACLQRANIGNAYMQLGAYRRAMTLLQEALDVAEPMGLDIVAPVRVNLGFALAQLGQIDEAIQVETAALRECIRQNNKRFAGCALIYLATMNAQHHDLRRAVGFAEEAVKFLDGDTPLRAYALATLARLLLAQKQLGRALDRAEEAMALLRQLGGMEEGESLVRTVAALALRAAGREAEGRAVIGAARERLLERAGRIQDALWRQSFLEGVQDNARLMYLAAQWLDGGT